MEEHFEDKFKPQNNLENDTMNVGLNEKKIEVFDSQLPLPMSSERKKQLEPRHSYSAEGMRRANFSEKKMRCANFSEKEMRCANYTEKEMLGDANWRRANYSAKEESYKNLLEEFREEFKKVKQCRKSKRWGNYEISEGKSGESHLVYDFTRPGWPLISPVQEEDMKSLESQLQLMSVETKTEKKKRFLEKIRIYRQDKTLGSFK